MTNSLATMVAPNGARKLPADHPHLPITIAAIAAEAAACRAAGAQALHLHVRDDAGRHTLDAARYLAATEAVRRTAGPDMVVQITTEAVGIFKPHEQMATVRAVMPQAVSIAPKELIPDSAAEAAAAEFYGWAHRSGIAVQHIVYAVAELDWLLDLIGRGIVPGARHSLIFPLGRYVAGQESDPSELAPFVTRLGEHGGTGRFDWWVCAFGRAETASLVAAAALGGHCRVGFENSFFNADGSRAGSNSERVTNVQAAVAGLRRPPASREETLRLLGRPA